MSHARASDRQRIHQLERQVTRLAKIVVAAVNRIQQLETQAQARREEEDIR